jgi:hypothetical protein
MFTPCFTMGLSHLWYVGDSPNVGPDSATSKTHVLLTKTIRQHQVNLWDFHQSTNVQAKEAHYPSTLANSTLIYIVFRNVEIFKKLFLPNQKIYCEDNSEYLAMFTFILYVHPKVWIESGNNKTKSCKRFITSERKKKVLTEDMKKNPAWQKGLPSNSAEQLGCRKNNNCIIVLK